MAHELVGHYNFYWLFLLSTGDQGRCAGAIQGAKQRAQLCREAMC